MILALVGAAQFMVVLDVSIVNVALPSIRDDLGFSLGGLQWVVNAYTITFGGLLLLGGRRQRPARTAAHVHHRASSCSPLASLAGAIAPNAGFLVVARASQGIGGAIVAPSTLAVLMTTFREGRERQRALGVWGAMTAGGGSAGAILGGILTDVLDWRWIFLVNVPSAPRSPGRRDAASPPTRHPSRGSGPATRRSFDLLGALTVTGRARGRRVRDRAHDDRRLDVAPDARLARAGGAAAGRVRRRSRRGSRRSRSCRCASSSRGC